MSPSSQGLSCLPSAAQPMGPLCSAQQCSQLPAVQAQQHRQQPPVQLSCIQRLDRVHDALKLIGPGLAAGRRITNRESARRMRDQRKTATQQLRAEVRLLPAPQDLACMPVLCGIGGEHAQLGCKESLDFGSAAVMAAHCVSLSCWTNKQGSQGRVCRLLPSAAFCTTSFVSSDLLCKVAVQHDPACQMHGLTPS